MESGDSFGNNHQVSSNSDAFQFRQYSTTVDTFAYSSMDPSNCMLNEQTHLETVLVYPVYNMSSQQTVERNLYANNIGNGNVLSYCRQDSLQGNQGTYFPTYQGFHSNTPHNFSIENFNFGTNVIRPIPFRNEGVDASTSKDYGFKPCITTMQIQFSQPSAFQTYSLMNGNFSENGYGYNTKIGENCAMSYVEQESVDSKYPNKEVSISYQRNEHYDENLPTRELNTDFPQYNQSSVLQHTFANVQSIISQQSPYQLIGKENSFNNYLETANVDSDCQSNGGPKIGLDTDQSVFSDEVTGACVENVHFPMNPKNEYVNNISLDVQTEFPVTENPLVGESQATKNKDVDSNAEVNNHSKYRLLKRNITPTMGNIKHLNFSCKISTEEERKTFFNRLSELLKIRDDIKNTKISSKVDFIQSEASTSLDICKNTFNNNSDSSDVDTDILADNPLVICENELICDNNEENIKFPPNVEKEAVPMQTVKRSFPEICPEHFKKRRFINGDVIYEDLNSVYKVMPASATYDDVRFGEVDYQTSSAQTKISNHQLALLPTNYQHMIGQETDISSRDYHNDSAQIIYNCSFQRQGKRLLADIPYRPWLKENVPTGEYGKRFVKTVPRPASVFIFGRCRKKMLRESVKSFMHLSKLQYTKESLEAYVLRNCNKFLDLSWPIRHKIYIMPDVSRNYNIEEVKNLFPVPEGWMVTLGFVGTEEPVTKIYNISVFLCENGWVMIHKNDKVEPELYLAASNLNELIEDGLARCDCIYEKRSVPYGIVMEGKLRQFMDNFGSLQSVLAYRKYLHGFLWAFNGTPGRLADRVFHTCVPGVHNALPLDAVIKHENNPLYFIGYVTTFKQQNDFNANVFIAVDGNLSIYGYHLISQKTWFLAKTFSTFLKMGTRKMYYDYEIPLKIHLGDSADSFLSCFKNAPCLLLKPEVLRKQFPKP